MDANRAATDGTSPGGSAASIVAGSGGSVADRLARAAAVLAEAERVSGLRASRPAETGSAPAESSQVGFPGVVAPAPGSTEVESAPTASVGPLGTEPDPEAVARGIVLRQLAMTARSRAQLEQKLRQRGCDDAVAATVLDKMTAAGLVDDQAYAEMLVRERQGQKGLARGAMAHELRQKGICPDLATAALGQVGAGDERVRAEELAEKKLRAMSGLSPDVQARRLAGLLARKGYPSDVAWPVIRDAIAGAQEHQRD